MLARFHSPPDILRLEETTGNYVIHESAQHFSEEPVEPINLDGESSKLPTRCFSLLRTTPVLHFLLGSTIDKRPRQGNLANVFASNGNNFF